ncbi:MAG TPA: STAS domain-containing protein [Anaerolineales bacterium]|nr:STAS domain-containing protein [Anaerolineales bacterium]
MEIKSQVYKRVVAVTVTGRVDSGTAGDLEKALSALANEAHNNIVLDLSGVEFLSSSGLRVLVTTLKGVRKVGGDVRLAQPSQRAIDAINLAGLDVLFKVFPDRESAIASY